MQTNSANHFSDMYKIFDSSLFTNKVGLTSRCRGQMRSRNMFGILLFAFIVVFN